MSNESRQSNSETYSPAKVNPFDLRSMRDLMRDYGITIPAARLRPWRLLYPHAGELQGFPQLGTVLILATNGIEAFYHCDAAPGCIWRGHLAAFTGPIAKDRLDESDWDFTAKKRKVRVFRKYESGELRLIVIPQDSIMDEYWEKHSRLTPEERECYEKLGGRQMQVSEFDEALAQLQAAHAHVQNPSVKSKRQKVLDML